MMIDRPKPMKNPHSVKEKFKMMLAPQTTNPIMTADNNEKDINFFKLFPPSLPLYTEVNGKKFHTCKNFRII